MATQTVWVLYDLSWERPELLSVHASEESAKTEADVYIRDFELEWPEGSAWIDGGLYFSGDYRSTTTKTFPPGTIGYSYLTLGVDVQIVRQ